MNIQSAHLLIVGLSTLSQSRKHDLPRNEGEGHDDYDRRTWRDKLNTDAQGRVVIPAHGLHQAVIAAARYSGKQIAGQGKKTWTAKLQNGLMFHQDAVTNRTADEAQRIALSVSSTGKRGVGGRVTRHFPMLHEWTAEVDFYVLDPILKPEILTEMFMLAGVFIGLGRFRPEVGGSNGRFRVERLTMAPAELAA